MAEAIQYMDTELSKAVLAQLAAQTFVPPLPPPPSLHGGGGSAGWDAAEREGSLAGWTHESEGSIGVSLSPGSHNDDHGGYLTPRRASVWSAASQRSSLDAVGGGDLDALRRRFVAELETKAW